MPNRTRDDHRDTGDRPRQASRPARRREEDDDPPPKRGVRKSTKVLLWVGGGVAGLILLCCGGVGAILAWEKTGDVEEVMTGEWGGGSTVVGSTRHLQLNRDGTFEEDTAVTWNRKGTWRKVSRTGNTVVLALDYTERQTGWEFGREQKKQGTMEVAFQSRNSITTRLDGNEVNWRREKWVRGTPSTTPTTR
jgi:hypothetical protein